MPTRSPLLSFLLSTLLFLLAVTCTLSTKASTVATTAAAIVPTDEYNFDKLSSIIQRLTVLEQSAPELLLAFFDSSLNNFSIKPNHHAKRVCITSTCYALLTMTLSSKVYDSIISYDDDAKAVAGEDPTSIPIRKAIKTLLKSSYRKDDIFQIPVLIYTILCLHSRTPLMLTPDMSERIKSLLQMTLNARPHRRFGLQQEHSDYITYQVTKVVSLLLEGTLTRQFNNNTSSDDNATRYAGLPAAALPDDVANQALWALLRCAELSSNELCRQLAYRTAGDTHSFDVTRLAYSLLTYIRSSTSLEEFCGQEISPGQGPAPETRVAPLNRKLIACALQAFFEEQNSNGLWDKGQPIYKHQSGKESWGNAFVFNVNTVGSLLCMLPPEDFRPHLLKLERTLQWIESHQSMEMVTRYTDPETGTCYGTPLRGWSSPHHDIDAGPQAWPTAQVLKCVSWMRTTIRQLLHNDVLDEFNGVTNHGVMQPESWDTLLDSDLGGGNRTIKSVLEERVVAPFETGGIDNPSYGAAYSAILFGPPGTAKTTLCEALAQRLGYDFVVIDTAVFLADGLSNVSARIRYVFQRLMALKRTIILFDEIEEFCLDRESVTSMESRMLTTAMLTAINDLRRNQQSIFFIATNRLKAFDAAITRPGRFDMQLFVGTPNLQARIIQYQQALKQRRGIENDAPLVQKYRAFLQSVWTQDAMFMNFLEGRQFASACADLGSGLRRRDMETMFGQQAAVMTVRGTALREEYLQSMEASRI